jgi:hypothetical protein
MRCGTRAFETADQSARGAAAMLDDGERLSRLWRYVFAQLLHDYASVLHHGRPGGGADVVGYSGEHRGQPGGRGVCRDGRVLGPEGRHLLIELRSGRWWPEPGRVWPNCVPPYQQAVTGRRCPANARTLMRGAYVARVPRGLSTSPWR